MIDFKKPLELNDGTPVRLARSGERAVTANPDTAGDYYLVREDGNGFTAEQSDRDTPGTRLLIVKPDGTRWIGTGRVIIRNRAAATQVFDPHKPVQTRGGFKARIVATLLAERQLVVEVSPPFSSPFLGYRNLDGTVIGTARSRGSMSVQNADDLVNVQAYVATYRNVYADGTTGHTTHTTRDAAVERVKLGKVRVGILKTVTLNGNFHGSSYEALEPFKRTTSLVKGSAVGQPYARTLDVSAR